MADTQFIRVEVAYAELDEQKIIALEVAPGSTAIEVARQSGIAKQFPNLNLEESDMGVFGKVVKPLQYVVQAGDRVEIYRPLKADPKEVRKKRAASAAATKKQVSQ